MKTKVSKVPRFAERDVKYVLILRERPLDEKDMEDMGVHLMYPEDLLPLLK